MKNLTLCSVNPQKNISGIKFGRLLAIKPIGRQGKAVVYRCLCDCGKIKNVRYSHLAYNKIMSCGCLNIEHSKNINLIHGMVGTSIYRIWDGIIQRCTNNKSQAWKDYGGRGIFICEKWLDFKEFYRDMGNRPNKKQIDRIDNNDGYYKENCRWASINTQSTNKRTTVVVKYKNKKRPLLEWSNIIGIKYKTLYTRIFQLKWSIEKSFTVPVYTKDKHLTEVAPKVLVA